MKGIFRKLSIILLISLTIFSFTSCATAEQAPAPVKAVRQARPMPTKPEAPVLPEVTEDMDFFKDGYEIVTVDTLADGDTTTFKLKSGTYTTRYLAVDTPETSNGVDPWGLAAKRFTNEALTNAKQIVLERDPELSGEPGDENSTLDKYSRLLAHIWVDGELLQYKLVEESLANVKYLYFPYKYNDTLIQLEAWESKTHNRRVHNKSDLDPEYDYTDALHKISLEELGPEYIGKRVEVTGIVSGYIKDNAYLQTPDGQHAVYAYSNHIEFKALSKVGNEATFTGRYTIYNGIPELSSPEFAPIKGSENNPVISNEGTTLDVKKENINKLYTLRNVTVESIDRGNAVLSDENGTCVLHNDKKTGLLIEDVLEVGKTYDITGNISVYKDEYQLNLRFDSDVVEVK